MQEFKKGCRFFVELIENLFVQRIQIVIQRVKGKLCISQGFNERSSNKLVVRGKLSMVQRFQQHVHLTVQCRSHIVLPSLLTAVLSLVNSSWAD